MSVRFISTCAVLLALASCARAPEGGDVLAGGKGGTVVYATTQCVSPNADGVRCDKKTCKKDEQSNCTDFATKCVENGHWYAGTNDTGTCSRIV